MNRRVGRLQVAEAFLTLDNIAARRLMEKIVVLDVQRLYTRNVVEFTALCEDFEECEYGRIPPEYRALVSTDQYRVRVYFERVAP